MHRGLRLAAAGLVLAVGACSFDEILSVQNPDELPEEALDNNPSFIDVLVTGVRGDFASMLDDPFIWRGSMFTDETLTGINWEQTARLNERIVQFDEGDADLMFTEISRALSQADSVSGRIKQLIANPQNDGRLGFTLAYAGYSYIMLADAMCEATINVSSEVYQPLQLYQIAVDRFNEALPIAQTAGDDDVVNMIYVGLSRAHLNLGNWTEAMNAAEVVPEDFRWYAEYKQPEVENVVAGRTQGSNHSLSVHPHFLANPDEYGTDYDQTADLTDPRVQHYPEWRLGHNRLTQIYTPYAPLMWENYNGATVADGEEPADLQTIEADGADIAFSSGLEARHNYMEAMLASGGGEGDVLTFVNERRAFGNQDPVSLTGDELKMELRDQRGRDLFLAGYRLGDLRRWLRNGDDMFPSGPHPVTEWGDYGDATCFPIPIEEYEGNPNLNLPS
jgi:tetratricopeptide (TPR) repeat protein